MSFFRKRDKDTAIIIDVGSSSVSLAYVSYKKKLPEVLYAQRHNTPLSAFSDFDTFLKNILEATNALFNHLAQSKKFRHPEKIFCYLPTLLHFSQVKKIQKTLPSKQKITKNFLNTIINEEIEKMKVEEGFLQDPSGGVYTILEQKVTGTVLNGYSVSNPYGKTVEEIEVSVFISYTTSQILENIARIGHNVFHRDDIEFHSGAIALFDVLKDVFHLSNHFTVLNLTGESAELLIVANNEIEALITYPFGYRTLIKHLSKTLSTTLEDAKTILKLYVESTENRKVSVRVEEAIASAKRDWEESVNATLSKNKMTGGVPSNFFILGDSIFSKLTARWLSKNTKELHISNYPIETKQIEIENIQNLLRSQVVHKSTTPLLIKVIFTNKLI